MEKKFDILSAGLMVFDIIAAPVDKTVFENDSNDIETIAFATGGDAFNVAVSAAKTGKRVLMGGVVGNDMPGKFLLEEAEKYGIDTSAVSVSETYNSSCSVVLCDREGQRNFAYYGKANNSFDGSLITDEMIASASLLYVGSVMALKSLEYDNLTNLFKRAKALGTATVLDSTWTNDGVWLPKIKDALAYTDIFIPSIYEAAEITGKSEPDDIIAELKKYGVKIAGVKLGKKGAKVEDIFMEAYYCSDEDKKDTTGAGDAFMCGFVAAYTEGRGLYECMQYASAYSNCCIREVGATTGIHSREQVEQTIKNNS